MPGKKKKTTAVKVKNSNAKNGNVLGLPKSELDKYQGMTVSQIQKSYEEIFKKPAKSNNRTTLIKSIWNFQLENKSKPDKSTIGKATSNETVVPFPSAPNKTGDSAVGNKQNPNLIDNEKASGKTTDPNNTAEPSKTTIEQPPKTEPKAMPTEVEKPAKNPTQNNDKKMASTATENKAAKRDTRLPEPGTVLSREYEGKTYEVKVLDDGCEFKGKHFRSLSGVAREITSSSWNGYIFWGLSKVVRKKAAEQ